MRVLLLLFILVPALELAILIELGSRVGAIPTLAILVFTGVLGAWLARREGLGVLRSAQDQIQRGEVPAGSVADGVMILLAATLLVTPGVLTDVLGFLLLVPAFRNVVKSELLRRFRRAVAENRIKVHVTGFSQAPFNPESYPIEDEPVTKYKIH